MISKSYLGSNCFEIVLPPTYDFTNEIFQKFQQQKLPVTKSYKIVFCPDNLINIPTGKLVRTDKEFEIIIEQDNSESTIFYKIDLEDKPAFARSHLKNDEVTVWYNPNLFDWNRSPYTIWSHIHLEHLLLQNNALILHSVFYNYHSSGILFTAPSGTGKTTHSKLWEKYIGGYAVNGDRTLLQFFNNCWYACGFPIHGGSPDCLNESLPLKAIVVLRQAKTNRIIELSPMQKISYLYSETTVNSWNTESVSKIWDLYSKLISDIKIVLLECNMQPDAAHILHNYLFQSEDIHGTV